MIIVLENGKQLRGDMIKTAILRNDLAPICETMEAEVRYDEDIARYLESGRVIEAGLGNKHHIVKSTIQGERAQQGNRPMGGIRITTLLDSVHQLAFERRTAVIKSGSSLAAIYRACGCSIQGVDDDFTSGMFACFVGDVPTFHVTRLLHEEGGVVRWRRGKLSFLRLIDLKTQEPSATLPASAISETDSGFLARISHKARVLTFRMIKK